MACLIFLTGAFIRETKPALTHEPRTHRLSHFPWLCQMSTLAPYPYFPHQRVPGRQQGRPDQQGRGGGEGGGRHLRNDEYRLHADTAPPKQDAEKEHKCDSRLDLNSARSVG